MSPARPPPAGGVVLTLSCASAIVALPLWSPVGAMLFAMIVPFLFATTVVRL